MGMGTQRLYRRLRAPLSVQVEVTSRCTQRCTHCYNSWRGARVMPEDMTVADAETIADKLIEAKVFGLTVTGGEPLLNGPVVRVLIEEATQAGIAPSLNSNLVLMNDELAQWLSAKGASILTSIMGPDAATHDRQAQKKGAFDQMCRGIEHCTSAGLSVEANMVITRANMGLVKETAEVVSRLGVKTFAVTSVVPPNYCVDSDQLCPQNSELFSAFKDHLGACRSYRLTPDTLVPLPVCTLSSLEGGLSLANRLCGGGRLEMIVGSRGDARACPHLEESVGNLLREDARTIWSRMDDWCTGEMLPEVCRGCALLPRCGGGCRFAAKMHSGSLKGLDPRADTSRLGEAMSVIQSERKLLTQLDEAWNCFVANPYLIREEDFGAVVAAFGQVRNAMFLTRQAAAFIASLEPGRRYEKQFFEKAPPGVLATLVDNRLLTPRAAKLSQSR